MPQRLRTFIYGFFRPLKFDAVKRRVLLISLLAGLMLSATAQNTDAPAVERLTLKGYVKDAKTGEAMVGAMIRALGQPQGAFSNEYGFYSLTIPRGTYTFVTTYLGFQPDTHKVELKANLTLTIELQSRDLNLKEVEITDRTQDQNVTSAEMSQTRLTAERVRTMPALFGEADVMRTLQLLPGVKSAGDGNSSIFVRGGNYDQNQVLLDEATVYNPSHLLGFFSVFNSDAVRDVNLIKGGIPAQYGGRLSSVLTVRTAEGNMKNFSMRGGIGLLSSRITLEGPFKKDVASWSLSFRRTYADLFLGLARDPALRNNQLYFYDLNGKVNWIIGPKDRVYLSFYHGSDFVRLGNQYESEWANSAATLRWNHLFGEKVFSNLTATFTNYSFAFKISSAGNQVRYSSGIRDIALKYDVEYFVRPNFQLRMGAHFTFQTFLMGRVQPLTNSGVAPFSQQTNFALQADAYISGEHKFGKRVTLTWGLRMVSFMRLGPGKIYKFGGSDGKTVVDSVQRRTAGLFGWQGGPEPRFAIRVLMHSTNSLKLSYMRTQQFVQVASNSAAALPLDLWVPSSTNIPQQIADQIAIGFYQNLRNNMFELSIEFYYKWLQNQIEFRNDARILFNTKYEAEFLFGKGMAYGMEVLLRKALGKTTGWIGYTLAFSQRQFDGINNGAIFYAKNDRRHELSVVLNQEIGKRVILSATWVYATGLPTSLPATKYQVDGAILGVYQERYGYRLPDVHRLDLSATIQHKNTKRWKSSWNISIYNVYAQRNPWAISLEPSNDGKTQDAYKTYLFTIVPSVTYNFRF
jgi:hypothetical protein